MAARVLSLGAIIAIAWLTTRTIDEEFAHFLAIDRHEDDAVGITRRLVLAATLLTLIMGAGSVALLGFGVARPLRSVTDALRRLARGETGIALPERGRRDEVGRIADATEVFRVAMIRARHVVSAESAKAIDRSAEQDAPAARHEPAAA